MVITDHQALIKWLNNMKNPSGLIACPILELQQYYFEIQYRKGTLNKGADGLLRNPLQLKTDEKSSVIENNEKEHRKQDWYS